MELYLKVRLACSEGMSRRQAAKHFNISRDSVSKMLSYSTPPGYQRQSPIRRPKLDAFVSTIDHWLDEDRQVPRKQRRGMFAGLKLNARPAPSQERTERPEREGSLRQAPAPDRLAERARGQSPLEAAVDRYSRAYESVVQHRRGGLPVLDMQRQEMRDAGQQLDQVQGGMKDLMRSTLQHDPATARAMTELSGRERVAQVIDGMKRENAALQDPNVRAERFVERWQELQGQRRELRGWQHDDARAKVESQMSSLAKSLERDPQAESLVRNRSRELGIGQELRREQSIARALQDEMTRGHRLSRGIGMER